MQETLTRVDLSAVWVAAVVGSVLFWTVVRRRAGRVAFVVTAGAGLVTVSAFVDAIVAERAGNDIATIWVILVVVAVVGLLIRPPWVLGQLALVAVLGSLGILVAYFAGGLVNGYGLACWTICGAETQIHELAIFSLLLAVGFFVVAWIVVGVRWVGRRRS